MITRDFFKKKNLKEIHKLLLLCVSNIKYIKCKIFLDIYYIDTHKSIMNKDRKASACTAFVARLILALQRSPRQEQTRTSCESVS